MHKAPNLEVPAQAGTHGTAFSVADRWIPACAGIQFGPPA
jgi:hypothetical protein